MTVIINTFFIGGNAMSQEIQAMSKREKQGKHWKELDQQSHWRIQKNIEDIKKKYYPLR